MSITATMIDGTARVQPSFDGLVQAVDRLNAAEAALSGAEQAVLDKSGAARVAKLALRDAEHKALTTEGKIDGKNEATRTAQLRQCCAVEHSGLEVREMEYDQAASKLRRAQEAMKNARAMAYLLAGGRDR